MVTIDFDVCLTFRKFCVVFTYFILVEIKGFLKLSDLVLHTLVLIVKTEVIILFTVQLKLGTIEYFLVSNDLLHVR